MNKSILVMVGLGVACATAGLLILKQSLVKTSPSPTAKPARQSEPGLTAEKAPQEAISEEAPPAEVRPAGSPVFNATLDTPPPASPARAGRNPAPAPPGAGQGGGTAKAPLQDPLAREALAFVGLDPGAETYWYAAINDPNLSGQERQDLIEDLNEDGLSDPKHPQPGDLPVILSRIQIIEAAGPYPMDQVNADAFQEAYRDLVNLANVALGGGEPVR